MQDYNIVKKWSQEEKSHTFYRDNSAVHTQKTEQHLCYHFDTFPGAKHDRQVASARE